MGESSSEKELQCFIDWHTENTECKEVAELETEIRGLCGRLNRVL